MSWTVNYCRAAEKQQQKLPEKVKVLLDTLIYEIMKSGPVRGNWQNYGKLSGKLHHCHLKKGKPTYVAVWREEAGEIKIVEITYVGTHEKAPY